jgi:methanol metabolism-related c-type cytochrome
MHVAHRARLLAAALVVTLVPSVNAAQASAQTPAEKPDDPAAVSDDNGKYLDKDGNPTFKVKPDGTVDFYTYAGFIRYSANCLQCHGPDGMGSTYAPSLLHSLQSLSYSDFLATVVGGKKDVNAAQTLVMPALGTNKNVMCYIDAIYVYLRARSDQVVGRGRPGKHDPKPATFATSENQCMD